MQNKLYLFNVLIKNQIIIFKNKRSNIVLFSLYFLLTNIFNLIIILFIDSNKDVVSNFTYINLFIVINSIFLLVILSLLVAGTLFGQITNNVHKLELRQGIGSYTIFFSRLIFILAITFSFLIINMIMSLIFAGIGWLNVGNDILIYRAFVSSWGWYFMFSFIVITLSVLIISIGKNAILVNTLVMLFSFLILLCVSLFSVLGLISKSSSQSNLNDIKYTNNFLMKIDNAKKLEEEINENPVLKTLSDEAFKNSSVGIDYFIAGYKTWSNFDSELLNKLSKDIEFIFKDSNLTEWEDILEFSQPGILHREKINEVAKYAAKNNKTKSNDEIFNFVLNNSENQSYYKSINLGHIINNEIQNYNLLDKIKQSYTADEFLFTKTIMEKIYFSNLNNILLNTYSVEGIGISNFVDNIKNNRFKNMINPFRHFVLMFQSVDYSNDILINQFGSDQILFGSLNNINAISTNSEELGFENLKLKRDIPVEVIYIIYGVILSLLLYASSHVFVKKIKL